MVFYHIIYEQMLLQRLFRSLRNKNCLELFSFIFPLFLYPCFIYVEILISHEIQQFKILQLTSSVWYHLPHVCGFHQYTVSAMKRLRALTMQNCRNWNDINFSESSVDNEEETSSCKPCQHFHVALNRIGTKSVSFINNLLNGIQSRYSPLL
jgi:hypothetical protein